MKKLYLIFIVLFLFPLFNIFSQNYNDDRPYLTDEDIRALEAMLPDDVMLRQMMPSQDKQEEITEFEPEAESISTRYYLVIAERRNSPPNTDVSGLKNENIIYKHLQSTNGYLLLIYTDTINNKVTPVYPSNSRVIFEFMTISIDPIKSIASSDFLKIFISQESILTELRNALR